MNIFKVTAFAFALATAPAIASAGGIDLFSLGYETDGAALNLADVEADVTFGDLLAIDNDTFSSLGSFGGSDSAANYALSFENGMFSGDTITSASAAQLSVGTGAFEVLFTAVMGEGIYAGLEASGGAVLAKLTSPSIALLPGGGFVDFTTTGVELSIQVLKRVTPIPLPAGVVLLATGLLGFGALRRAQKA